MAELEPVGMEFAPGVFPDEAGVRFTLFSEHAERVELCLFSADGGEEVQRVALDRRAGGMWSEHVPGVAAGALYGYRVHGPWAPDAGHRFNPAKLLLDPYARQVSGELVLAPAHFGHSGEEHALQRDTRDSAPFMPKCIVVEEQDAPAPLREPPRNRVIYEAHVRGLTISHEGLAPEDRGRFAGMADSQVIDYLRALGITSVELMPLQYLVDEPALVARGLRNYWGYNTLAYFAPAVRYGLQGHPAEFRHLVDRLHDAGIEVILDVVYNHTGEGDHFGPTLCFRGIDNSSYYRLDPHNPLYYVNDTGCGNTLDVAHPRVRAMVLDSLSYWAESMGVDGFRFDLATTLAREADGFRSDSAFFSAVSAEPRLAGKLLIAEPWDIGPGGYQLGQFPQGWSEWNDRYRDTVRRFWRGDSGVLPELAERLHGSADVFEAGGRGPSSAINFVTSHDGFTLADLVSYAERHNEANGEDNRDGHAHNFSFNCGVEGPSGDEGIIDLRQRQSRNLLATLLLSQGTPMLLAGDELGRSQGGNNNAYCQDNATSWVDWRQAAGHQDFVDFTRYLVQLRRTLPLLSWPAYIHDTGDPAAARCQWFTNTGKLMTTGDWHNAHLAWLGMLLTAPTGEALLLLLNASGQNIPFRLPGPVGRTWKLLLDTANRNFSGAAARHPAAGHVLLRHRSLSLLQAVTEDD